MQTVSATQMKQVLESNMENSIFIDVRTKGEYNQCHIEGAKNIPLDELPSHATELKNYDHVYVQCGTGNRSGKACNILSQAGLTNVVNVEGGLEAWKACQFGVVKKKGTISIMRQVQIVAGSLVIFGGIFGLYVYAYFVWLSIFVGAGLLFAGLTGSCTMARILSKMPWNN